MSVQKGRRKRSGFEVFDKMYVLRRDITDLLLRDFGYKRAKAIKGLEKRFGGRPYEQLSDAEKHNYDITLKRHDAFAQWYVPQERQVIINYLREANAELHMANSIMPEYWSELEERRLHQDKAIGYLTNLEQELMYIIESMPVDINTYTRFSDQINNEIVLIKAWRKSDNKFKSKLIENEKKRNPENASDIFKHFLSYLKIID